MSETQARIDYVLRTRAEHVEKFTAAFIREVGSAEASRYALIESHDVVGGKFEARWEFRPLDAIGQD